MLIPNGKQNTRLFQFAGTARFAYNWALGEEQQNYSEGGKFLSDCELRKRFTQLKPTGDFSKGRQDFQNSRAVDTANLSFMLIL